MKHCHQCGYALPEESRFCPQCGVKLPDLPKAPDRPTAHHQNQPDIRESRQDVVSPSFTPPTQDSPHKAASNKSLQDLTAGDTILGRFRIEKRLGPGSLCYSFLVSTGQREPLVLKLLNPRKAQDTSLAESFLFLARSVAAYDHPGIARIFDAGHSQGLYYYLTERVEGQTMRSWLLEKFSFENRVLAGVGLMKDLLGIFETIHEKGCYGCLKPENVFLTSNGPKIMDFGVVGFLSPQEFEFNSHAKRYLSYMAPELKQDWANLVPQSDYYSLGAILYEILVGKTPGLPWKRPSAYTDIYSVEVDELMEKALAPRPMERFVSGREFWEALGDLETLLVRRNRSPSGISTPSGASSTESARDFGEARAAGASPFQEPAAAKQPEPSDEPEMTMMISRADMELDDHESGSETSEEVNREPIILEETDDSPDRDGKEGALESVSSPHLIEVIEEESDSAPLPLQSAADVDSLPGSTRSPAFEDEEEEPSGEVKEPETRKIPTEFEVDSELVEEEAPPISLGVKVALVVLGLVLAGGAGFLGIWLSI